MSSLGGGSEADRRGTSACVGVAGVEGWREFPRRGEVMSMCRTRLLALAVCGVLALVSGVPAAAKSTFIRVSLTSSGKQSNGASYISFYSPAAVSAGGSYVVFESDATNLAPSDRDGQRDVFLRDRVTGNTELLSKAADGSAVGGTGGSVS